MSCTHPTRHIRETFVLYNNKPNRSSVEWVCKECGTRGIVTIHFAFYHESCRRTVGEVRTVNWAEYQRSWAEPRIKASF